MQTRTIVLALLAGLVSGGPAASQWKLAKDDYASYTIDGRTGVEHLGFFGDAVADGRRPRREPTHPALISLWLLTSLPETLDKGAKLAVDHTFTRFEAFTPVRVVGSIKVSEAVGPLRFLEGKFKLRAVRPQSKDQRFFLLRGGALSFTSQFDADRGVMTDAAVRYEMIYDEHVKLQGVYSGQRGKKKRRAVKLDIAHLYQFNEVIPITEFRERVDAWVDAQRDKLLTEWAGNRTNENPALQQGYDALYTLAMLHAHVPKNDAVVQKAWERVRATRVQSTYSAALVLLLVDAMYTPDAALTDPERAADRRPSTDLAARDRQLVSDAARYLLGGQQEGGWGYYGKRQDRDHFKLEGAKPDNSNTQLALMGLNAARRLGAKIPAKTWTKAIGYWARRMSRVGYRPKGAKRVIGGWDYDEEGRGQGYLAMTAGALASATIIHAGLAITPKNRSKAAVAVRNVQRAATAWLAHHFSVRHGQRGVMPRPKLAAHWAYHMWAIERAGGLGQIEKFGDHDWYREGAMAIVNDTYASPGEDYVYEALCLLFLRRTSAAAVTPSAR